ncbi:prepilin-type N-terminal cleavage/methylation domain-containing protein [Idiomarina aquatica]|uniref:MSHA pilin protein MshC n=1 Tax=Idiomarina aquatica TaxID=1327752 RepID=A0AA94JE68_9GAMM|nr:prepilin-type N-terminal cleavage/methylation domain-containing protein [Idiomarina aquatica]RUO45393.1 hypothetical protein CWE23_05145 [Idiomarina aquatica]
MRNFLMPTRGFTIIELIVIIIVVGILAVSAYPLMGGRSGVDVAVYQAELVSLLRQQQQRAMQDTATDKLYSACVADKDVALFTFNSGVECPSPENISQICAERDDCVRVEKQDAVTFRGPERINFDSMGCPYTNASKPALLCAEGTIIIEVDGETTREIMINQQGYIQALN